MDPSTLGADQRAARLIYLNRYCFNGLYRTNLVGQFNVPYGGERSGSLPTLDDLKRIRLALQGVELRRSDFRQVLWHKARQGDFIYLDPPYAVSNRRVFRQYGPDVFGYGDLCDLADLLEHVDAMGATFVLSYADCKEARDLFGRWRARRVLIARNISGFAKHRRRAAELLITNSPQA